MHTRVMILALCVVAAVAIASTNVVFYNTETPALCYGGGASTNITIPVAAFGSGYLHGPTQAFTAASGYEVITAYVGVASVNMGTLTDSNLTVATTGYYFLTCGYSVYSSADDNLLIVHAYTNGVFAENAGCSRYFEHKDQYGTMTMGAILRMVANDYVDLRLDCSQNCTLIFEHADATLIKIGP